MNEPDIVDSVAAAVRRYIDAHPHAMDTIEGIAQFWLLGYRVDLAVVERAVERLVERGDLEVLGSDREGRYRARRRPGPEN